MIPEHDASGQLQVGVVVEGHELPLIGVSVFGRDDDLFADEAMESPDLRVDLGGRRLHLESSEKSSKIGRRDAIGNPW